MLQFCRTHVTLETVACYSFYPLAVASTKPATHINISLRQAFFGPKGSRLHSPQNTAPTAFSNRYKCTVYWGSYVPECVLRILSAIGDLRSKIDVDAEEEINQIASGVAQLLELISME